MPSLVPVNHDPFNGETGNFSLAPVEYDPFAAEKFASPLGQAVVNAGIGLATLPQRAIQNAQYSLDTGTYDPGPTLEAATLPMGTGAIAGVPVRAGEAVLGAGPIRAHHGSPHDFDAFDLSKIGTGEGAQAYGHGLYFAENEGVAKSYRDALAQSTIEGKPYNPYNALHVASAQVEESGSRAAAIKEIEQAIAKDPGDPSGHFPRVLSLLKSDRELPKIENSTGKMYEVNINADPEHFLDWDKPLSEQSQQAQEAARKLGMIRKEYTGSEVYKTAAMNKGAENAVSALREAGIPGIKYLDQGSRASGDGSRNYVVFNDKLIDIIKKYGLAGIAALPPALQAIAHQHLVPVDHDPFAGEANATQEISQ